MRKIRKGRIQSIALSLSLIGFLIGCSGAQSQLMDSPLATPPAATQQPEEYLIQSGDQLDIKFFYNPELNETVQVRPDGKISLQLIDEVQAAGLTPSRLDELITKKYTPELRKPEIAVILRTFSNRVGFRGG